jgi:hypothetical protein
MNAADERQWIWQDSWSGRTLRSIQ